jgi:hypothetical protein
MMRIRSLALLGFALVSRASAAWGQRPDSSAAIIGVVTSLNVLEPLQNSIVSVPALGIERLTNSSGQFVLRGLTVGPHELLVRHLGYAPARLSVIARTASGDTVRIKLTRLAVQLSAMQVRARTLCTNPGPPRASVDPAFAAIFDQLKQNADAYRLLSGVYPFTYDMQRDSRIRYVSGEEVTQRFDTVRIGTGVRYSYAPGRIIDRSDDPRNRQVVFNIPALIHFADATFLANHCFAYGGLDTADGGSAIRIDFAAASKIKTPDVDGSMYLDPSSYQIRRSVLRLTKIPAETPEIEAVTVTTEFKVLVPSIAIASSISAVHTLFTDLSRPVLPMSVYEIQRLLKVTFLKEPPH